MCSASGSAGQSWNRRRMWHTLQFPMHKLYALGMGETVWEGLQCWEADTQTARW